MKKGILCFVAIGMALMISACGMVRDNSADGANMQNNTNGTADGEEKTILTLGYIDEHSFQDLDDSIQERIVSFNKSQDDYYIEIVKYGEDSLTDGLNALNADIASGKAPDIIAIDDEEFMNQLGEKGAIEDLYSYIDDGNWPQREDFAGNILQCFEKDKKLYGVTPYFSILSIIGNPEDIASDKITFAQLKEMYEENKENKDVVVYNALTRFPLLDQCILASIDEFVDMESKSCNFDREEFQELLEFSAQFEESTDAGWYCDTVSNYYKLQEGRMSLFYEGSIEGFEDYNRYRALTGKSGLLVGFPSLSGCAPRITTSSSFLSINSESKHKDAAWQFICTFLDNDYLSGSNSYGREEGFPVTERGFELAARKALDKDVFSETEKTNAKGEKITYAIGPATEEEVAYIRSIIENIESGSEYIEIENIIAEEVHTYWNGNKTVQETIEVIQNRVSLYLEEL